MQVFGRITDFVNIEVFRFWMLIFVVPYCSNSYNIGVERFLEYWGGGECLEYWGGGGGGGAKRGQIPSRHMTSY